jgi:hypothetical protein
MSLLYPYKLSTEAALVRSVAKDILKQAAPAETSFGLAGRLFVSSSGWLLLSVPNALARGAYDALQEQGVELPTKDDGKFNAHISVMRPEELESIGGPDKITERGHTFRYTLGRVKTVEPEGWPEVGRVWLIEVYSPELQTLRKSYGLSPLPKHPFHITIGIRRRNVLYANDVKKGEHGEGEVQSQTGIQAG